MEKKPIVVCKNCRFYAPKSNGKEGTCRRHAPTTVKFAQTPYREWPVISNDDWCGEFQAAE